MQFFAINRSEMGFKMKQSVLVTGANGLLGRHLIQCLVGQSDYSIIAVGRSRDKVRNALEQEGLGANGRICILSNDELLSEGYALKNIYGAVHLAFSRHGHSEADIASSIEYSMKVFNKLASSGINNVINVSSQGVYGNISRIRSIEEPVSPNTLYSMAKYATEKILEQVYCTQIHDNITSIRMDNVIQSQNLVKALCRQAKEAGMLQLRGGSQVFSYIDMEDAAEAIAALLNYKGKWAPVYNVGHNQTRYNLLEIADMVADTAEKNGYKRPEVVLEEEPIELWAGMDTSLFMADTKWKPQYDIRMMIERIFQNI